MTVSLWCEALPLGLLLLIPSLMPGHENVVHAKCMSWHWLGLGVGDGAHLQW